MNMYLTTTVGGALLTLVITLAIYIGFFIWKKKIAQDILEEKGYPEGNKRIGALMFFLPVVCWIYVIALPKKNNLD